MSAFITWAEFKQKLEQAGVTDETQVRAIDVWQPVDGSFTIHFDDDAVSVYGG